MGFLSSLFSGRSKDDDDDDFKEEDSEAEKEEKEDKSEQLPKLENGMAVNVTLDDGKPLLAGKIKEFADATIIIERNTGQFAFNTCDIGTLVYLRCYGSNGTRPFDLKGTVELSQRIVLKVKDLAVVPYDEHRSNFRLVIDAPVQLFYEEDAKFQSPEHCHLVNISIGGACIESEYAHTEGEILRMKVQLEDYVPMTFMGEVIRVDETKPGIFRYGFLFAQLDEHDTTNLTRVLFNLQVNNKRAHERSKGGYWV